MDSYNLPKLIIDDAIPFLKERLDGKFIARYLPGEKICRNDSEDADGLIVRTRTRCDAGLLEGTPVKFVATATIGVDHIDTDYCYAHNILWQNAPGCNAPAVAQYVWRALFKLGFAEINTAGETPTLGVVGKGHVGSIVVEWGRRLGFNVIVSDPPRKARGLDDEDYLSLEELMQRADAVTFHTPLIKKPENSPGITYHLADEKMLSMLKPGAILINAARGGIVDEDALIKAKKGKNLKICIDTWEGEPKINPATLKAADIATFHIAGYSLQGKQRATRAILEGLERCFGVPLMKDGLANAYTPPEVLTREVIERSYDIMADDTSLRNHPSEFEIRRKAYSFRNE